MATMSCKTNKEQDVSLQIKTAQVALLEQNTTEDEACGKRLAAEIACSLPEPRASEMLAPELLCVQVHAVNLSTNEAALLISYTRAAQWERLGESFELEFEAPSNAGLYHLQIVAFLLGADPQIVTRLGPRLRVETEEAEATPAEDSRAPESFGEGLTQACDARAAAAERNAQNRETPCDIAPASAPVIAAEPLCSDEAATLPAEAAPDFFATACESEDGKPSFMIDAPQFNPTNTRLEAASRPRLRRLAAALRLPLEFLSLLGLVLTGFSFPFRPDLSERQSSLLVLEQNLQRLQAMVARDRGRQAELKKIFAIMERDAPEMQSELKLAIAHTIHEMTIKHSNLDLELICATITHETGRSWNPRSLSPVGARGLMQIMPLTGEMLASAEGIAWSTPEKILFDPILNLRLGCRYLSTLVNAYNIDGGLAAYNGGEKRAEMWLRQGRAAGILANETSYYVPSILKLYAEYRRMGG